MMVVMDATRKGSRCNQSSKQFLPVNDLSWETTTKSSKGTDVNQVCIDSCFEEHSRRVRIVPDRWIFLISLVAISTVGWFTVEELSGANSGYPIYVVVYFIFARRGTEHHIFNPPPSELVLVLNPGIFL